MKTQNLRVTEVLIREFVVFNICSHLHGQYCQLSFSHEQNADVITAPIHNEIYQRAMAQPEEETYVMLAQASIHEHFEKYPKTVFLETMGLPFPVLRSAFNATGESAKGFTSCVCTIVLDFSAHQIYRIGREQDYSSYASIPFRKHFPYLDLFNK